MEKKVCLITGANAGIGFETAKAIAAQGTQVWMISRNREKGEAARQVLQQQTGNKEIYVLHADLGSQDQIQQASVELKERVEQLDILINNAGTWFSKLEYTEDQIETVFAVNHLGPFLLTRELYPLLEQAPSARIINVSSDSHFNGTIQFDDLYLERAYNGMKSYAQSKLGNVLFTREFERRKPAAHISVFAVQPGLVYTDIGLKHTTWLHALAWKARRSLWRGKTPAQGAATSIYLAMEDGVEPQSGTYWDNCKPKPSSPASYNDQVAERLWEVSLDLCGLETYFPLERKAVEESSK